MQTARATNGDWELAGEITWSRLNLPTPGGLGPDLRKDFSRVAPTTDVFILTPPESTLPVDHHQLCCHRLVCITYRLDPNSLDNRESKQPLAPRARPVEGTNQSEHYISHVAAHYITIQTSINMAGTLQAESSHERASSRDSPERGTKRASMFAPSLLFAHPTWRILTRLSRLQEPSRCRHPSCQDL